MTSGPTRTAAAAKQLWDTLHRPRTGRRPRTLARVVDALFRLHLPTAPGRWPIGTTRSPAEPVVPTEHPAAHRAVLANPDPKMDRTGGTVYSCWALRSGAFTPSTCGDDGSVLPTGAVAESLRTALSGRSAQESLVTIIETVVDIAPCDQTPRSP